FLRSWKNSFLIGISIPVSLVFTFFAMYLADVDLNIVSLAGLAIAVGMLVDNSIIVIESIHRHRIQGKNKVTAAVEGTKEVAGAITSSTLTTLAVFLPVLFVPGFSGQMFKDMALTVSFSLIISLLVAISLVPALSALFVKTESTIHILEKVVARASRAFRTTHRGILTFCLDHRWETIGATALLFACSLLLSGAIPASLMPTMDQGNISISFGLVQGVDLAGVDSVATVIEQKATSVIPEEYIESMMVSTGSSSGGMFLSSINEGTVRISLVGSDERERSTFDYTFMLLNELGNMPGVDVEIMMHGMTSDDPAAVVLTGDDLDSLTVIAQRIKEMMDSVEGTSGVYTSIDQRIPEITFIPDQAKLSLAGITGPEIVTELRLGFMGSNVATLTEGGEEYNVFLRYPADHRADRVSLAYTPVLGYPLTSLGNLENISNPSSIDRENQTRIVTIATGTAPGYTSGQVGSAIEREMEKMDLPDGVTWRIRGEYGDQGSTFSYLMLAVLVAILLVYMVMAGQFESLKEPFIIILTVPMALIGVVTILFLSGTSLSIIALIGVLMLAGIAVNDGIVLVDYANQLRRKGMTARSAIIQAAEVRARPIIMTTMTTVLAMIPVAVGIGQGSEMWRPLGIVVIGGLFSAMVLSLVIEPCLYVVTAGKRDSPAEK
ncbi:MAG: efflux RND transporter permease subunit, partial [Candidatus Fermentibacteraceae bacterium]|nr:efflux RND transporter permease subunit [Candidatus Fermentibacteraceae bacterium]